MDETRAARKPNSSVRADTSRGASRNAQLLRRGFGTLVDGELDPRMGPGRYCVVFGVFFSDPQNPGRLIVGQAQPSTPFIVK
jgi:hypothetical protein